MNNKSIHIEHGEMTTGRLLDLMDHVDELFPEFELGSDGNVLSMAGYAQWLWARSENWMDCLEEIVIHMQTPIFNSHHYYYIGREFKE